MLSLIALLAGCGGILLILIFHIISPKSPTGFGSIIPDKYFYYFFPLLFFYHTILNTFVYGLPIICGIGLLNAGLYLSHLTLWEYRLGRLEYRTIPEVREIPAILILHYRSMQLFFQTAMLFIGPFLVPFQTICLTCSVFCNSMLIKYWNYDNWESATKFVILFWAMSMMAGWACVLIFGGSLHRNGMKVLVSWKNHDFGSKYKNQLMKKIAASSQPIMLNYGNCFVIRKGTILNFFRLISRGTVKMLLVILKDG